MSRRSATAGDDTTRIRMTALDILPLQFAEVGFAMLLKDISDRHLGDTLNFSVHVEKPHCKLAGHAP